MDLIFIFVFWLSIFFIVYTYFFYPFIVGTLAVFIRWPVKKDDFRPSVSIIIAAHNEEASIEKKIKGTLELDYPKDKLEIIIVSDASDDNTDKIVLSFKKQGVILVRQKNRLGKTSAQNKAVEVARGEIILFSDATTVLSKDVVKKLVRNFADDNVGCVGAELIYVSNFKGKLSKARKLYWLYEKFLRRKESGLHSLLGVSGCCYAVRKKAYKRIDPRLISDFIITWLMLDNGYRSVFEPEALVYEDIVETAHQEIGMRTRVASRSLVAFKMMGKFLNPFKFGLFSFELFSHKLLRYFVPIFIILIFLSNLFLVHINIYRFLLYGQFVFLLLGLAGLAFKNISILQAFSYFFIGNYSILKAFLKFGSSKKFEVWQPLRNKR